MLLEGVLRGGASSGTIDGSAFCRPCLPETLDDVVSELRDVTGAQREDDVAWLRSPDRLVDSRLPLQHGVSQELRGDSSMGSSRAG